MNNATYLNTESAESATLDRAIRIIGTSNVSPQSVGRKLMRSGVTLAIGLVSLIVLFFAIRFEVFQGPTARPMTTFLLIASGAVVLLTGVAMSFTVWSAFVHQHVQLLEAKSEVAEVTRQLNVVLYSMEKAIPQAGASQLTVDEALAELEVIAGRVGQEVTVEMVDERLLAATAEVSRIAPEEYNVMVVEMRRTIEGQVLAEKAMSSTV